MEPNKAKCWGILGEGREAGWVEWREGEVEASQPTWDDGPQLITNLHTLVREAFFSSFFARKSGH